MREKKQHFQLHNAQWRKTIKFWGNKNKKKENEKVWKNTGSKNKFEKVKYVCKHIMKSLPNQKACPHLCIAAHSPDPHSYTQVDLPYDHEWLWEIDEEPGKMGYLFFFPLQPPLQFGLFALNCFFPFCLCKYT